MDLKEVQDIVKNLLYDRPLTRTEILMVGGQSLAINTTGRTVPITYKEWRVVAVGFNVYTEGISTQDPETEFGIEIGNLGASDTDYFGSVKQDTAAGDQFISGDVYVKDPLNMCSIPKALNGGGTPTWDDGAGHLLEWQTYATALRVKRQNDHQLTVMPFFMIEVRR